MKLAKPLKAGGSPLMIVAVSSARDGGMAEQLRMLHDSFRLKAEGSGGVGGVSWHKYEKDLDANLHDLFERLKTHRNRAKQIRRKCIPKASGKLRALGTPSLEDKIV